MLDVTIICLCGFFVIQDMGKITTYINKTTTNKVDCCSVAEDVKLQDLNRTTRGLYHCYMDQSAHLHLTDVKVGRNVIQDFRLHSL